MKNVCFDFDGTVAEYKEYKFGKFGELKTDVVEIMWELYRQGYRLFIATTRSWAEYDALLDYLEFNKLPPCHVVMGSKPIAVAYVDDRAINVNEIGWKKKLEKMVKKPLPIGEIK